jgi:hypothetical protein
MSNAVPDDGHQQHHGSLHELAERIHHHHEDAVHRREEAELAFAAEKAGFDLETDLGHPMSHPGGDAFDMGTDLGIDRDSQ